MKNSNNKEMIFSNIFMFRTLFLLLLLKICYCGSSNQLFDSYLNTYKTKEQEYEKHIFKEVANTTWREFYISENITNLNKAIPAFLDNDKELDLIILETNSRLYWYILHILISSHIFPRINQ